MQCEFMFDFASPNAYLSHPVIGEIEKRNHVQFDYQLILLGGVFKATNNQPPMLAFQNIPNKLRYMQIEIERFIKKHGLSKFQLNPHFPMNTLKIMRIAIAAQEAGVLPQYIDVVLSAMWEQGLKMDDADVIKQVLQESGLNADALIEKSQTDPIKQRLIENTEQAAKRGVFGVPTFFIGEEMFFGKDSLGLVEEEILKQKAA